MSKKTTTSKNKKKTKSKSIEKKINTDLPFKNKNKETIKSYFKFHKDYTKIYGEKTVIMMRVGHFYEFYSYPDEGPDLSILSKLLGIEKTRRNSFMPLKKYNNPELIGFNHTAEEKYAKRLVEKNYTIVVVEESIHRVNNVKKDGSIVEENEIQRHKDRIYSKCNYGSDIYIPESNYTACIYIEEIGQRGLQPLLISGMAAVDLSTGKVCVHEASSTQTDTKYALDECNRFIDTLGPQEIVVYTEGLKIHSKKTISDYLELHNKFCHFREKTDKKYSKLSYQKELLEVAYSDQKSEVSVIQQLGLSLNPFAVVAMTALLDFAANHEENIVNNLEIPELLMDNKHIVLGNNAQKQLCVIESELFEHSGRIKSLLDVLNKASTGMGERFIRKRLTSPIINHRTLNKIYNIVDILIKDDTYKLIRGFLKDIKDIAKLNKKLMMKQIKPKEVFIMVKSLEKCRDLFNYLSTSDNLVKIKGETLIESKIINEYLDDVISACDKFFNYEELAKYDKEMKMDNMFFNKGIDKQIDKITSNIKNGNDHIQEIRSNFHKFMVSASNGLDKEKNKSNKKTNYQNVKIKLNAESDKNGKYFLRTTRRRAEELVEYIKLKGIKEFMMGEKSLKIKKLRYDWLTNDCKIYIPSLTEFANNMNNIQDSFIEHMNRIYEKFLYEITDKHSANINKINQSITYLDYYSTIAYVSEVNHYTRPTIKTKKTNDGYVIAKELRHPIIENVIEHEYIPHNINIGKDVKGMIVYGLNSSGKSALMKAIGLSVVMAQAGFFVPAGKYTYSPYSAIYTRITGHDNIFKGLSSFALGNVELNAIVNRSDNNTLVLGDEVGRSTEYISGTSVVGATLMMLSDSNSSFVFATHLHDLAEEEEIVNRNNIKTYHLSSENGKDGNIIYDRKLKDGPGERVYGVKVAKSIIKNKTFIENCMKIKNSMMNKYSGLIGDKKSRYNSSKYVYKCEECDEKLKKDHTNLETHHINFQKDFNSKGIHKNKKHVRKNAKSNLAVLCTGCHDKIDSGELKISSKVMTSKGVKTSSSN